MRIVRNIGYIRGRQRAARTMVGLGLLLVTIFWVLNFLESFVAFPLSLAGIVTGFVLFYGGLQQLGRWSRKPRNDEALDAALARLNDRYALVHYADFPGRRPDHILVTPNRLLVISTRELMGRVRARGRSWRRPRSVLFGVFRLAGPQLGNPTLENEAQVNTLVAFLREEQLPGTVEGIVVFTDPRVDLELDDPALPVLRVDELFDFVRFQGESVALGTRERDRLVEKLSRGEQLERIVSRSGSPKKRARAA